MPEPISLCIENLEDGSEATRFIRCVALGGNLPGLGVDRRGRPLWRADPSAERACELWVSADERLMLWRSEGAPTVTVCRAGRSLDAPEAKPVVILDQDELEIAGVRLRLHVHGPTTEVHAPMPFVVRSLGAAAVATALAVGAAAAGCSNNGTPADGAPIASIAAEGSTAPAASAPSAATSSAAPSAFATASGSAAASSSAAASATTTATKTKPIEVRIHPPKPVDPHRNDPLR